jgi:hypothetical protein
VRADLLQARRPGDVHLLVEARHQLHHHRDFLAALGRLDEDFHELGVGAGAVTVCLIAMTRGSVTEVRMKSITGVKDS